MGAIKIRVETTNTHRHMSPGLPSGNCDSRLELGQPLVLLLLLLLLMFVVFLLLLVVIVCCCCCYFLFGHCFCLLHIVFSYNFVVFGVLSFITCYFLVRFDFLLIFL